MVANNDLGERLAGVSVKRVRAVSTGLSRIDESVVDAVASSKLASGAVDVSIAVPGKALAGDETTTSASSIPIIAAKNDLKNVSNVRWRIV